MLLLFVGGVINLIWIVGLSVLVLAEKLVPPGRSAYALPLRRSDDDGGRPLIVGG